MAFADLDVLMDLCEGMVRRAAAHILSTCSRDVQFFTEYVDEGCKERLERSVRTPFHRITYTAAVDAIVSLQQETQQEDSPSLAVLQNMFLRAGEGDATGRGKWVGELRKKAKELVPLQWGDDLMREHERFICETLCEGNGVFLTHYPQQIKPFYMRASECADPAKATVECMDLLMPYVGEMAGGSVREEREQVLRENIRRQGLTEEGYDWYLDLRKHGSVPHGGFGLGYDRMVQWVTGVQNIRDVVPIPRHKGYCKF